MGLEVNLAALDGRRERVKLTSQLSCGVGSGTQERHPRRSTTRTGRVGAFSTAEGRFHMRERFSNFSLGIFLLRGVFFSLSFVLCPLSFVREPGCC